MDERFKQFLTPPIFPDEEQNRIAGILNVILFTLFLAGLVISLILIVFGVSSQNFGVAKIRESA